MSGRLARVLQAAAEVLPSSRPPLRSRSSSHAFSCLVVHGGAPRRALPSFYTQNCLISGGHCTFGQARKPPMRGIPRSRLNTDRGDDHALSRRYRRETVLGAAPRTRLCGVVIVLIAAAAAVVQPANIFGRTLPMERPAPAGLKLWAIALDGKSGAPLQPALFHAFARDGINAIVTARTGWTRAQHLRLVQLTKASKLLLIEPGQRSDSAVTRRRPPVHHRHARPDREAHCREQQRRLQRTGGRCRLMRCFRLHGGFGACVGPQRERALRRAPCRLCPDVHADSRRRHHEDARDRGREALGVRPTRADLAERDNHCSSGGSRPRGGITRWHRPVPR